jgi:hypothetical protein
MRRLGWGLAVLGLAAAVAVAPAQGTKYRPGQDNGLLKDLFGSSAPKPDEKTDSKKDDKASPGTKTTTRQEQARQHDRLMKTYLRRQAVCDRLEEIARETGNEKLREEAERLHDMAWKLYQEGAGKLQTVTAEREAQAEKKAAPRPARGPATSRLRPGGGNSQAPDRSISGQEDER